MQPKCNETLEKNRNFNLYTQEAKYLKSMRQKCTKAWLVHFYYNNREENSRGLANLSLSGELTLVVNKPASQKACSTSNELDKIFSQALCKFYVYSTES